MPKNITECFTKLDETLTLEPHVAAKAMKRPRFGAASF